MLFDNDIPVPLALIDNEIVGIITLCPYEKNIWLLDGLDAPGFNTSLAVTVP